MLGFTNMVNAAVVLDNVLCFLLARYNNTVIKQLKSIVLDFYSVKDICRAKENILHAIESWKPELNLPHIPLRRDGEQRASKTLDDIVTTMSCLDEKLKLSCLPKFVAESPDSMPSLRVYDGDLWTLMAAFDKLKERMCATEATLAAILQAVNSSRDMLLTHPVRDAVEATTSVDINSRAQLAPIVMCSFSWAVQLRCKTRVQCREIPERNQSS